MRVLGLKTGQVIHALRKVKCADKIARIHISVFTNNVGVLRIAFVQATRLPGFFYPGQV